MASITQGKKRKHPAEKSMGYRKCPRGGRRRFH